MIDDRRAAILRAVVEEYIDTGEPVGSLKIAARHDTDVKPATIRNELAQLEADGYLLQPHTSSGRVPTDMGYRFYVDSLNPRPNLDDSRRRVIAKFFRHSVELERMLQGSSRMLAQITACAAVIAGSPSGTVRHAQLVNLGDHRSLGLLVLSTGAVKQCTIKFDRDSTEDEFARMNDLLQASLVDQTFGALKERIVSHDAEVRLTIAKVVDAFNQQDTNVADPFFIGGASQLAGLAALSEVLRVLEEQRQILPLLRDAIAHGNVLIGRENGNPDLANYAVVAAPFLGGGTVGIVGPKWMNYTTVMGAVDAVSRQIDQSLSLS